ncbi:enoyl-CoA hydratase/isomerase family protein [Aquipuribacter hungaricus]|uniref:Enoyl-CoA hydratase/isomerase family protein n=1 Tax=Aquipuribacter hungaricus TaxID=545624 RepID=A0ABV7WKW2_9MICO
MDPILDLALPDLDVRRDGEDARVLVVRLDDPGRRNAMGEQMTASWCRLVDGLRATVEGGPGEVRAVVVTGAGSAFSAGGDLSWLGDGSGAGASVEALRDRMARYYEDWLGLRGVGVPVVAAVNGAAVGAGLGLALACDVRLVGASARLSAPFTALGLHPGMGTTRTLAEAVGPAAARELLLTGRTVGAEEAVRFGLATAAYPDDRLLGEATALARTLATRAPVATRLLLRGLADGGPRDLAEAVAQEAAAQATTLATADLTEGLAAARERRAPRFTGR